MDSIDLQRKRRILVFDDAEGVGAIVGVGWCRRRDVGKTAVDASERHAVVGEKRRGVSRDAQSVIEG